ncbi:uncharacterized protein LOC116843244 isoform X1 [Odontomachus brunneus]|uniref:uncharacterized protein LOC116843244 isoform X1 n=1 Tax=Odontomachus brunneus TaxID=486640 RepID=UPI0013F1AA79|nr:uncharacterized protein LOC116843244 isoform X1 [Odontomachus brunneus]
MGVKHSIYESPGTLNYYKFSVEEYALVKRIWSEIEINPQNHGSVYFRSFCETYPQYIKFFTLEPKLPMNFDMRTTEKFSKIFEAMGYLLLDFNNKPKQLDRFVGYIAMVHKDMRLNEQDMHRFMLSLLDYLSQTYPKLMTAQCRDAMSKYMESIAKELSKKMEIFRCYDIAQLDVIKQPKLLWGWCKLFVDPLIFRKTKFYWSEWKKQWDARLDEWAAQDNSAALDPTSQMNDEDTVAASKADDDNEVEVGILQQQRASMITRRTDSDVSASRLALLSISKTSGIDAIRRSRRRGVYSKVDESRQRSRRVRSPRKASDAAKNSRERHRIMTLVRDVSKPQADATVLRRRLRSSRMAIDSALISGNTTEEDGERTMAFRRTPEIAPVGSSAQAAVPKSRRTARERRRENFNVHLQ